MTPTEARGSEPMDGASNPAAGEADGAAQELQLDAALPSVEAMEDLILEAYNNMQSDGEHIFLPSNVASKLQYIAQLVTSAGYTSDDLVSNGSESNQEDTAQALHLSGTNQSTAPPSAVSSAPSSPPTPRPLDGALLHHVSLLQLGDNNMAIHSSEEERKPAEALSIDSNNFLGHGHNMAIDFGPALSPVQEISEDLLSVSDFGSIAEPAQLETLTPPKSTKTTKSSKPSSSPAEPLQPPAEAPKSRLRKPEVHRKTPGRPSSVTKSQGSNKSHGTSSRTNLLISRFKAEPTPPSSRERSTSSSYEQRREATQKLREEKAQRELQARESARKQREDARRQLEEAQQKELAAKRERVARMKMKKDQRKGPVKPTPPSR